MHYACIVGRHVSTKSFNTEKNVYRSAEMPAAFTWKYDIHKLLLATSLDVRVYIVHTFCVRSEVCGMKWGRLIIIRSLLYVVLSIVDSRHLFQKFAQPILRTFAGVERAERWRRRPAHTQ